MTSRKRKNNVRLLSAVLLTAMFISTMLFEPLHYFFISHGHTETIRYETNPDIHSGQENCPVCDFDFCTFINDVVIYQERCFESDISRVNNRVTNAVIISDNLHKKGRAPPIQT